MKPFLMLFLIQIVFIHFARGSAATKTTEASQSEPVFRFHMPTEPSSIDPARLSTSDASYFLTNVMRGLYTYRNGVGLVPEGASRCRFETKLRLRCRLAKKLWSDNSAVVAEDYVRAFRRLVGPSAKSLSVELLENLVNAGAVHSGKIPLEQLGIHAPKPDQLQIDFEKPDPEFLYKLTYSSLVPVKSDEFPDRENSSRAVVNGPYFVAKWTVGRRIRLEPNTKYDQRHRIPIEILIIDDDQTALNLYEQGELTFLRRLPTTYIETYRSRPDFKQIPVLRFDYIGFGEAFKERRDLREALASGVNYKELGRLLDAAGTPGCAGLRREYFTDTPCLKFDPQRAQKLIRTAAPFGPLKMTFSKLGGDDVKKAAEWFQAQWKKNLGLDVRVEALEQNVQLATLRKKPPPLFRKGLHPERPTCLSVAEAFSINGSENFLRVNDPIYEKTVIELNTSAQASPGSRDRLRAKKNCTASVTRLLDEYRIIPLGSVQFTLLAQPKFRGWVLNEMNQLDLAGLEIVP